MKGPLLKNSLGVVHGRDVIYVSSDIIEFEMKKVQKYSLFDIEYKFEYVQMLILHSNSNIFELIRTYSKMKLRKLMLEIRVTTRLNF